MAYSDFISSAALLVATAALVVSILVARKQNRLAALQIHKEEKLLEEALRADVGANIVALGDSKHRLRVFNKGKAAALDVDVKFPNGNSLIPSTELAAKFPHPRLDPHQSVDLVAAVHFGTERRQTVVLSWKDPDGTVQEKTVYPTI